MTAQDATGVGPGLARLPLARTAELMAAASPVDALAATRGMVIASDRYIDGEYPMYIDRAEGAYMWDVDGNRYVDFQLAYGTVILGHRNPRVDAAVVAEAATGFATGMMKPVQAELARELVSLTPHAEMAMFLKTGSDATSAALRLARSFTGRNTVVRWGYNGWHDWCATRPYGVPAHHRDVVDTFELGDPDSVRAAFDRHPGDVACVLTMPFEVEPPPPGFLQELRRICDEHGALLVLDEMRSGFRLALGGAQEHFGVRADLVTFSKAMANGYPISAVVGRSDVLMHLARVHISSTFYSNSDTMAAALATIGELRSRPVLPTVWSLGTRLQAGLRSIVEDAGLEVEVVGLPPMPFLRFRYDDAERNARAHRAFYTATIRAGVLFLPNHHWYVSGAHTEEDVDLALEASSMAAAEARREAARG